MPHTHKNSAPYTIMEIVGGVTTYVNDKADVKKDNIIHKLIPENISECALHLGKGPGEPCMSDSAAREVGSLIGTSGDPKTIVDAAKSKLGCDSEACVLQKLEPKIGSDRVRTEIQVNIKIRGPTDTRLLSNYDIDNTLQQWAQKFSDFYPYNFNMLNYTQYSFRNGEVANIPDSLATVQWRDLYTGATDGRKYRCCACVINSDKYQGNGKHWMALFADTRGANKWTIEFFNSSGNAPAPEWINWLVKTRDQMEEIAAAEGRKVSIEIIKVCKIRHQQSRTECGVYSLFYIWARLNGQPPDYFLARPVPDQLMMEFRQHLFIDPTRPKIKKFNFSEYSQRTRVEWE